MAGVLHVFIETNWVVAYGAPAHQKVPAAIDLLKKANDGVIQLHLPSVCITECRRPIREKFQVRSEADSVRRFLLWAKQQNIINPKTDEVVRQTLDRMESLIKSDLDKLEDLLSGLQKETGLEIFGMDEEMLGRSAELSNLGLQPFDQAILACILVKAETLRKTGIERFAFCEADSDLQPWDRRGDSKEPLVNLYDNLGIWVYGDFLLEQPKMPENWPAAG